MHLYIQVSGLYMLPGEKETMTNETMDRACDRDDIGLILCVGRG